MINPVPVLKQVFGLELESTYEKKFQYHIEYLREDLEHLRIYLDKLAELYGLRSYTKLNIDFVEEYVPYEVITLEECVRKISFLDKIFNIDTVRNLYREEMALTQEKMFLTSQKQYLTKMLFELLGKDIEKNLDSLEVEDNPLESLCICIYSVESSGKVPLLYILRKSCDIYHVVRTGSMTSAIKFYYDSKTKMELIQDEVLKQFFLDYFMGERLIEIIDKAKWLDDVIQNMLIN